MEQYDKRVDAYIAKSAPFAQPILEYIREIVHETSPLITENVKWGFPFFEYKGIVCHMSAFKEHLAMGFWKMSMLKDPHGVLKPGDGNAGSFGRITCMEDLPSKEILVDFILQAIALNEAEVKVPAKKAPATVKTELVTPDYFINLLKDTPNALPAWDRFSPSQKKEYVEWILDAKSDATRQKRLETAAEWISEGKSRHWKYQR